MATKANLKTIPVEHHIVSSSDVVEYLQNQLGIAFDCDFQLLDNRADWEKPMTTHKCYVMMRVVFRPEDICVSDASGDYVDHVLRETGAGRRFKDNVINVIKPFMFPENMPQARQDPVKLQQFAEMGLYGEALEKLMRRPGLFYDQVNDRFGVYLRPERIIGDMCADPDTNKIDGTFAFGYVSNSANNAAAITWGVNVYHGNSVLGKSNNGITIDAVFNGIKAK